MRDLAKDVPAVTAGAPAGDVLRLLRQHGVAVLVDDGWRPAGVLTCADVEGLRPRLRARDAPVSAASLFQRAAPTLKEDETLAEAGRQIVARELKDGAVLVDASGRYRGYLFSSDLAGGLAAEASQCRLRASRRLNLLRHTYPEDWDLIRRMLAP